MINPSLAIMRTVKIAMLFPMNSSIIFWILATQKLAAGFSTKTWRMVARVICVNAGDEKRS